LFAGFVGVDEGRRGERGEGECEKEIFHWFTHVL
jgi:hypothetical protein